MVHEAKQLHGCKLQASDGEIGKVTDFYFDDETWTVRYLVADAGHWYGSRKVLISPDALMPRTLTGITNNDWSDL